MRTLILTLTLALCAQAQWLNHPSRGIPRLPGGKPNLTAPAPRTGGKPDLSGIWQVESSPRTALAPYTLPGGENGLGEADISVYYANFFADYKFGEEPFLPAAAAAYRQTGGTRGALCSPPHLPVSDLLPVPFKIVQTRDLTLFLYEDYENFRQIHTDGRSLPPDPQPTFLGYSVGKWEGATFVVTSAGFNHRAGLDAMGHPHSEALRVTERFRRIDFGHMELQVTMEDPKTYSKAVTVNARLRLLPDMELLESVCELEKDQAHMRQP